MARFIHLSGHLYRGLVPFIFFIFIFFLSITLSFSLIQEEIVVINFIIEDESNIAHHPRQEYAPNHIVFFKGHHFAKIRLVITPDFVEDMRCEVHLRFVPDNASLSNPPPSTPAYLVYAYSPLGLARSTGSVVITQGDVPGYTAPADFLNHYAHFELVCGTKDVRVQHMNVTAKINLPSDSNAQTDALLKKADRHALQILEKDSEPDQDIIGRFIYPTNPGFGPLRCLVAPILHSHPFAPKAFVAIGSHIEAVKTFNDPCRKLGVNVTVAHRTFPTIPFQNIFLHPAFASASCHVTAHVSKPLMHHYAPKSVSLPCQAPACFRPSVLVLTQNGSIGITQPQRFGHFEDSYLKYKVECTPRASKQVFSVCFENIDIVVDPAIRDERVPLLTSFEKPKSVDAASEYSYEYFLRDTTPSLQVPPTASSAHEHPLLLQARIPREYAVAGVTVYVKHPVYRVNESAPLAAKAGSCTCTLKE